MKLFENDDRGVYTIAEMSGNHAGSLDTALKMVKSAKKAGADCLKIQTYLPDSLTIECEHEYFKLKGGLWDGKTLYELYKEGSMPYEWQGIIFEECNKLGLDFLSTPFDQEGADFLESLGVGAYKVASFELIDIPLIRHIAKKGKPMIVSTGMGSIEEIQEALDAMIEEGLSKSQIILLKCTSEYPAEPSAMNLMTIEDMKNRFDVTIGFSDHSLGITAPVAAVAFGARVIEKHYCLSHDIGSIDEKFSLDPSEFKELVKAVNATYLMQGEVHYGPSAQEMSSYSLRRSIFSVREILEGELFDGNNIRVIRPGDGLKPKHYSDLLGKKSKVHYRRGEPIQEKELGEY